MPQSTLEIWDQFHDKLFRYVLKKVKDPDLAKDLIQEIFIKIHIKIDTLRNSGSLPYWVFSITKNVIIDHFRRENRQRNIQIEEESETKEAIDVFVCIKPFINELDEKYKQALMATDLGSQSQKQYAESNGISYSAAKSRIQRAREQLKILFNNCCTFVTDHYGNVIELKNCKHHCGCQ